MGNCLSSQSPAAAAAAKSDSANSFKGSVRSPMGFSRQRIPAEFLDGFPSSSDMAYPVNNRGIATIVTQPKGEGRSMTLPGNKFSISFDDNLLGRKRISRGSNIDSAVDSSKERSQFQSAERLIGGRDASLVLSVQKSQTSIMSSSSGGVRRPHHRLASVSCSQLPLGKADKGSQTKQSVLLESRAESCGKIESNHTNAASCISSSRIKSNNKDIEDESKDESSSDLKNCSSVGTTRPTTTTTTTTIGSQPLASPTINSSKANPIKDQEPPLPLHILKQTIKAQVNQSEAINQTQPSPGIKNNRSGQSFVGPEKSDPNGLDKSLNLKTSPILETNLDEDNVSIGLPQRVVAPLGTANSPPLLTSPKLVQNENLILSPSESQVSSNSSLGPLTRNDSFTRAIEEGSHKDTLQTTNPTSPVGSRGSSEGSLELDSDSTASWFEAGHIDSLDLDEFRDVDDLPPSDISSSKPAQLGHPCASKNGENDPTSVKVASSEPLTNAKAVLMRRACSVPSEAHINIGIPLLVHTQNLAQENLPGKASPCAKPNEVRSPPIIQDKNPTNKSGLSEAAFLSKKPEDKPIRVASKQRAQGQENQEHFAPDGRRTADIVKDEKGQEATCPSSQIQEDCQSARKGSVRRPDKASQNEKNGEIQETKKDEHGKVQGKDVQINQGQAALFGDKEIGNQADKYEPDLESEGGSEKTMSSLAGSSFQRSVAFDLTISDERHSSSSSSSSSSEDGENGEHTREEQKVLEKVETPTKEGDNQVDQTHALENNGDYCVKTTTINKSCTSDDKSKLAPMDHKEEVLEEPKPNDEDQTNMTNDEPSTSLPTTPTKPKGILKPSSNSEALRNSSFPSLPETFLLKLGVNLIPTESANFSTDNLSDQDIESKFTALSLAFNTDKLTLNDRLELQQRQRDTAEKNIDEDIRQLKTAIGSLNKVCTDAETREMLHRLQKQVDVLRHSSERVSSSAEVYGAVQQEARISRAIEIMLHHVDNLKRIYEREHVELQDAKKILADNNLSIAASNSLLGASGGLSGDSGHNSSSKANSNRGRSISVINPSGTAVTFGPGTNGASSAIRKQGTAGPVRKTSNSGGLRIYGAEGRESGFSTISEHGEAISGGKFDDSFESRVAGQSVRNEAFRGDSNNNNNHLANGDFLKKSDDFNSIPDYGARNRRSDRVRSTSLIEPVKEEEEDAILEEIDTLAMKRDSSPAPHSLRRVGELPWLSYFRTLRQYFRYLLEWYQEFTWPWDWDETILGVRYAITGVLLFAAFISLVFTFFGGGGGSVKVTDAT